jgi:hypothetical protein
MPEDDLKNLLQKNLEVSQESLKILKKINRARIIGNIFTFLKWMIIIGASIGIYYYIQPYLGKLTDLWKQLQEMQNVVPKNLMPR